MNFGWEPIPWPLGYFRARKMKRGFVARADWPLVWRKATEADWPPVDVVSPDLDWARRTGTSFIATSDAETLYLFERDWFGWPDPPQWGLASQAKADGGWHLWGSFADLPLSWTFADDDPRNERAS